MSSLGPEPAWDVEIYATFSLSILELETVLFGMVTAAVILLAYTALRPGVLPFSTTVKRRIARFAACIVLYALFTTHLGLSIKAHEDLLFGLRIGNLPLGSGGELTHATVVLWTLSGSILLECALFGAFCTLIILTIYTFTWKALGTRSHQTMLAVAMIMFSISLAHWTLQIRNAASKFNIFGGHTILTKDDLGIASIPMALVSVNVALSDAIVLWRMCVLCNQHIYTRALAVVLLSVTIALGVVNVVKENSVLASEESDVVQRLFTASFGDSDYGSAVLSLSLITNLVSTMVIGWRTWCYRRDIATHLSGFSRTSIVEKVMTLLVESGCVYCVIWIAFLIQTRTAGHQSPYSVSIDGSSGLLINGNVAWFSLVMAQLTGIYPTIILVVVALEQSYLKNAISAPKLSAFLAALPTSGPAQSSRTQELVSFQWSLDHRFGRNHRGAGIIGIGSDVCVDEDATHTPSRLRGAMEKEETLVVTAAHDEESMIA